MSERCDANVRTEERMVSSTLRVDFIVAFYPPWDGEATSSLASHKSSLCQAPFTRRLFFCERQKREFSIGEDKKKND